MKGIILAGGAGTRLYPMTLVVSKQLQPIFDKPMIYYPLSLLMMCNIKDVLIISTPKDLPHFRRLFESGKHLGMNISYKEQDQPRGISHAYILAEEFLNNDDSMMILGDNLFYGDLTPFRLAVKDQKEKSRNKKARIFAYPVNNPSRFGVVELSKNKEILSLEEKPLKPKSHYAIPGLYLFDGSVSSKAKMLSPSDRNELEILDLMRIYHDREELDVQTISRGMAWLDTGTPKSLMEASSFISSIEERQGLKVACLEEIALRMNFINIEDFSYLIKTIPKGPYKHYLKIIEEECKDKL